jgi:RNA ligase (TIGR02306 family)
MGPVVKHPNADRLNIGQVGGWTVVVGLDVKENDLGVYFEIDSILPEAEWSQPLKLKGPIKTMKIRNVLSQGLFVPLASLPLKDVSEEDDVTEILGVSKREDTQDGTNDSNSVSYEKMFPIGPPKTDEPRIQSRTGLLKQLEGKPYYMSIKYDGCSLTVGWNSESSSLVICSRNQHVPLTAMNHYTEVCQIYQLEKILKENPQYVLQCEVYGPKIQKNLLNMDRLHLAVFNIWDVSKNAFLNFSGEGETFPMVCDKLGLPMVEIVERGEGFTFTVPDILEKAKGFYSTTKNHREGLVVRPQQEQRTLKGERLSFKCINNDYLLKHD